jgi:predicted DNA binding protein
MEKVLLKIMDHDCWVTQVTQKFKVTLEILGCEGKGCFLRIKGESEKALDFVKNHKDISSFTILSKTKDSVLLLLDDESAHTRSIIQSVGAFFTYPIEVREGNEYWNVITPTKKQLKILEKRLSKIGNPILEKSVSKPPLTLRQKEIIDLAFKEGYFETPRRITLDKLAEKLGISASSLGETLRLAMKRMLEDL